MRKILFLSLFFCACISFASNFKSNQIQLGNNEFSSSFESAFSLNRIGVVNQERFSGANNSSYVDVFEFKDAKYAKLTGRKMMRYFTKSGYKITSWYTLGSFFIVDFVKLMPDGRSLAGVAVFGYNANGTLLGVLYITPKIVKVSDWHQGNKLELQTCLQIFSIRSNTNPRISLIQQTNILKTAPSIKFMGKIYQLKDSHLIGTAQRPVGMAYEFLPVGQSFDSWKNLITVNVMNMNVSPKQYADNAVKLLTQSKKVVVDPLITNKTPGVVYLVSLEFSRATGGDGSVYLSEDKINHATVDLQKTQADLITERNIHKLYSGSANNTLIDVFYGERRYGHISEVEYNKWSSEISDDIDHLDKFNLLQQIGNKKISNI